MIFCDILSTFDPRMISGVPVFVMTKSLALLTQLDLLSHYNTRLDMNFFKRSAYSAGGCAEISALRSGYFKVFKFNSALFLTVNSVKLELLIEETQNIRVDNAQKIYLCTICTCNSTFENTLLL